MNSSLVETSGIQTWDAAMRAYQTAREKVSALDAENQQCRKCYEREYEQLLDEAATAEFNLASLPPPNITCLVWKIEHAATLAREMDGDWPDAWWEAAKADIVTFHTK